MSDLHLEVERWRLGVPGWAKFRARHRHAARHPARGPMLDGVGRVDLVVLAGDVHNGLRGVVYADQVARYLDAPVVMVAGNHEYYHHDHATLLVALRAASAKTAGRVRFLENEVTRVEVRGRALQVFGCTLWTDYALLGAPAAAMATALARMNDHRYIHNGGGAFLPPDALAAHRRSRDWLLGALAAAAQASDAAIRLVVTHHAPSGTMVGRRNGAIAPCYGSDLLPAFIDAPPDVWVHGHTHYRHVSLVAGMLVASAPRGYVVAREDDALRYLPGIIEV